MPLRLTAALLLAALFVAACGSTPDGESRIKGVDGASQDGAEAGSGRLSPTEGLEGGVSGGAEPGGAGFDSGLGDINAGLASGSGGTNPADMAIPPDLAGLPGAAGVLALIAGTVSGTYTIDYAVDPSVMTAMVVANAPGRQSIHSVAVNGTERWSLYESNLLTVDCEKTAVRAWVCQRVPEGSLGKGPIGIGIDTAQWVAGLSAVQLNPVLILALLAPPLEGTQGVVTNSRTTVIAGANAQCLQYAQPGRPPAEICANDDAVPVRLASRIIALDFTLQARSYQRGVASDAFVPPAPV